MSPVEKFNPQKMNALSFKRRRQKDGRPSRGVEIRELTFEDVRADALNFGLATNLIRELKSGKEAAVYLASWKGYPIALKAYRFWRSAQARKKRGFFAPGKMETLAAKEYDVLLACFRAGANVPTPIGRVGNYLTMRFIGDHNVPAPRLYEIILEKPAAVFDMIIENYLKMYRDAHYVHGDLSAFNILWWQNKPWIIDVPQANAVNTWCNMNHVVEILKRDIGNLIELFERYDVERDFDTLVKEFVAAYVPHNQIAFEF